MAKRVRKGRERGHIRQRGGSFQVLMYAGIDPITGKEIRLVESTTDPDEAERILARMRADITRRKKSQTRATFGVAVDRWLRVHEVEETTRESYRGQVERVIRPALGDVPAERIDPSMLEELYADLRRCSRRCRNGEPALDHRTGMPHECRVVKHKRRPGRPKAAEGHDCIEAGCTVVECPPHRCRPMGASGIRQIHWIISSVLSACVRWGWIPSNPAEVAKKPRKPVPDPDPPSTVDAARIVDFAWQVSPDWGMFVWLVFVTGMRRGEAVALRWSSIDLTARTLRVRRNWVVVTGQGGREKDTKSHQERTIALDDTTVELLQQHRRRYERQMSELAAPMPKDPYLFSYAPTRDQPYSPSGVSHKYVRMCAKLGIDSHLHALRHYSATALLTAGVDLRTVAGRLGHGGGGSTTLREYAKFVGEADRRAADLLGGQLKRPGI